MIASVVRTAGPADAGAIAAIYRPHVLLGTATFETEPPGEAEIAARIATVQAAGYPYLAAETNGGVAGFAYASAFRSRAAFRHTVENSVYVAEEDRRQGIARALLQTLIEECASRGFQQMIAVIGDPPAQGPSIALHRALGFTGTGLLPAIGFKHGRRLDVILMQRGLS